MLGVGLVQFHLPLWAAVGGALAAGLACGLFNGLVSVAWGLPSFIVTLGMLEMARGGAHFATHSQTQYIGAVIEPIAGTALFGLSLPFMVALITGLVIVAAVIVDQYRQRLGK